MFWISGFSENMSLWLVDMALIERRRTRRLMRDMRRLNDPEEREERLREELEEVLEFLGILERSIARLEQKSASAEGVAAEAAGEAAREERTRQINLRRFIKGLDIWLVDPMAGTY